MIKVIGLTRSAGYRARTTASGSAIRHDRQRRHVRLSEPAPPRRVDGDLSPRRLALPLAVVARGGNPMLGEDFRPVAWKFSSTAKPHGQIFARRKEWRRLSTPIDSAGCRRLSPIRLCLTGAAPTSCARRRASCATPPSQRRSQLSHTSCASAACPRLLGTRPPSQKTSLRGAGLALVLSAHAESVPESRG